MSMYSQFTSASNLVRNIISSNKANFSIKAISVDLFFTAIQSNPVLRRRYNKLINLYYEKYNDLRKAKRIVNSTLARSLAKDLKPQYNLNRIRSEYNNVINSLTDSFSLLN